jgi:hypothetical protein
VNEQLIFNFKEGQRRKENGIPRHPLLEVARELAVELLRTREAISADDVQFEMLRRGYRESELGNAMGALFRDKRFEWTGGFVYSARVRANGNRLMLWRLKEGVRV